MELRLKSRFKSRLRVNIKIRMEATYNKILLLVADLDSVYGIGREGTAGISCFLYEREREKQNRKTITPQHHQY